MSFVLRGVRAVLPDRILDPARVVVSDGRVEDVLPDGPGDVDGSGAWCLPGLIDSHSDGLEKEIHPRFRVSLDETFALQTFERRLLASGVTTAYHGVAFEDRPDAHRTVEGAARVCDAIKDRRWDASASVDHRLLFRVEARSPEAVVELNRRLGDPDTPPEPLVSFEDHAPGQGQFRDLDVYKDLQRDSARARGDDLDAVVAQHLAVARAREPVREQNLSAIQALVERGLMRALAHDCATADEAEEAARWGASGAEFPLTEEAAARARTLGMEVVMGAPNVVRGGSHAGHVAAEALVKDGQCTVLASDYLPSALLAAVFILAERRSASLPRAVGLASIGPARLASLCDRGQLAPGARADLVLVDLDRGWPRVREVWTAGVRSLVVGDRPAARTNDRQPDREPQSTARGSGDR